MSTNPTVSLVPELIRLIARTAHPNVARALKLLNRYLANLITNRDLQIGEMRWRLETASPRLCLFWASRNGLDHIVSMLLLYFCATTPQIKPKDLIHAFDKDISLVWAAGFGHDKVVSVLLANGADINAYLNAETDRAIRDAIPRRSSLETTNRTNPLSVAAKGGHAAVVSLLLKAGADVHCDDDDALYQAASIGADETVALLLAAGAEAGGQDGQILQAAAEYGHSLVVKLLLAAGRELHNHAGYALIDAAENGHKEVVALLLAAGCDPRGHNYMALQLAASRGFEEVVDLLLEAGAADSNGNCALIEASCKGHDQVVSLLLASGADPDENTITAALRKGHYDVLESLLAAGAQPELYMAVSHNLPKAAMLMLEYGADVHHNNDNALFCAVSKGDREMTLLLLAAGWDSMACREEELAAENGVHGGVVERLLERRLGVDWRLRWVRRNVS